MGDGITVVTIYISLVISDIEQSFRRYLEIDLVMMYNYFNIMLN